MCIEFVASQIEFARAYWKGALVIYQKLKSLIPLAQASTIAKSCMRRGGRDEA